MNTRRARPANPLPATLVQRVLRLILDRRGLSAVEYALICAAIIVVGAAGFRLLGRQGEQAGRLAAASFTEPQTWKPSQGGGTNGGGGNELICDGRSCGTPGACFVAGTLVATPSGDRPIESLHEGDLVLARGERDEVAARPILRVLTRAASSLTDIHVIQVDGTRERVRSTPDHPYFTLGRGWSPAASLLAGETLVDRSGREVRVAKVVAIPQEALVYNFVVDVDHTYFVGETGVLVHNGDCDNNGGGGGANPSEKPRAPVTGPTRVPGTNAEIDPVTGEEIYYRVMQPPHAQYTLANKKILPGSETFISPTQEYVSKDRNPGGVYTPKYQGVLIKIKVKPGTTEELTNIGVTDSSRQSRNAYPNLPKQGKGWMDRNAVFKSEEGQINIGLGKGAGLDKFNENITSVEVITRPGDPPPGPDFIKF